MTRESFQFTLPIAVFGKLLSANESSKRRMNETQRSESERKKVKVELELERTNYVRVRQVRLCKCLQFSFFLHFIQLFLLDRSACSAAASAFCCGCANGFWAESWVLQARQQQQKRRDSPLITYSRQRAGRLVNIRPLLWFHVYTMSFSKENCSRNGLSQCEKKIKWNEREGEGKVPPKKKNKSADRLSNSLSFSNVL